MKQGFTPISIARWVEIHLQSNPGVNRRDLVVRLERARDAFLSGVRCRCGGEIWIIGSAESGLSCFSCATGEVEPDSDYEIDTTQNAQPDAPGNAGMRFVPIPSSGVRRP